MQDYEKFINSLKSSSLKEKLVRVNLYFNEMNPKYDSNNPSSDYWASLDEFLKNGGGDCEDYAIAKYTALKRLGLDKNKMYLAVVKEKQSNTYHMVLLYFKSLDGVPFVLDNLNNKILPLNKRFDIEPLYMLNSSGIFDIDEFGTKLNRWHKEIKQFEDLKKRGVF